MENHSTRYGIAMAHEDDGSLIKAGYVYRTKAQAERIIRKFEAEDRRNGCYEPDSYTIQEVDE